MKPISMKHRKQTNRHSSQTQHERRGSTLLVVIGLLAILALMGVIFYTFAAQESSSAENFADAAINEADPGLQADVLFNWGLEQLIKGPDPYLVNSALWGGSFPRHSMLFNMVGTRERAIGPTNNIEIDPHPYNGQGINVIFDGNALDVDQNYDGTHDGNRALLNYNISPVATKTVPTDLDLFNNFPQPDVDYTSPDINSLFLAYKGYVPGLNWPTDPTDVRLVIIPSFHRPQHLRDELTGSPIVDTYNDTTVSQLRVFRPHNNDHFIHRETQADSGSPRFSTNAFDGSGDPLPRAMGIWTGNLDTEYFLDIDNDGDTIREGVWLDLDFPPIEDPQNAGQYIIPMFSFTVYDADGLINLNTAGNMRQPDDIDLNYPSSGGTFGNNLTGGGANPFLFLSRSHQGLSSPGEINPQWAMTAVPPSPPGTSLDQHQRFFGALPAAWPELSNMEYFFLNYGRAEFTSASAIGTQTTVQDLFPGRWGEPNRLFDAQRASSTDNLFVVNASGVSFPRAGQTFVDDNADRYEGSNQSGSLQGSRAGAISFKHPLAYNGAGRSWGSGVNYRRTDRSLGGFGGPATWPLYSVYEIAGPPLSTTPASVRWPASLFNSGTANENILLDDSDEIVVDMEKVQRPYDEPFGPEEMAHLFLSNNDISLSGVTSRLNTLLPRNFGASATAGDFDRRKRFTTMSWDRKQFSRPVSIDGGNNQFPPPYTTNPFRIELLELMGIGLPDGTITTPHQLKLNLNQVLVFENTGTGRTISYRPLTPHPGEDLNGNGSLDAGEDLNGNGVLDALTATEINQSWSRTTTLPTYPPNTIEKQEFWARYDRQNMARDIYTLLYSLNDFSYGVPTHSDDEKLQMAQFAVNVVDALDSDDVLTRFEFDNNLDNGWGLDDNPYTNTPDEQATGERRVVWGVEAQQLTLSEFLLVECQDQMSDLNVTQFPDDKVDGADRERFFTAIELRNNSPYPVQFGARGKWMIGLEVPDSMGGFKETYAIPKNRTVAAGGLFTFLSTNSADNLEISGGDPYSEFRVDLDGNGAFNDPGERIIPATTIAAADKIDFVKDQATSNSLVTILNDGFTDITGSTGSFLDDVRTELSGASGDIKVKLFRKAHLGRDTYLTTGLPVPDRDNPWVLVDEISVSKSEFNLATDTAAAAQAQLDRDDMRSRERSQPLNKRDGESMSGASGNIRNTIGLQNSLTTGNFSFWQPHFDRDFSSPIELFSVPIVGPTQEITAPQTLPLSVSGPSGSNLDGSSNTTKTRNRLITYALANDSSQQTGDDVQVAGIQKFLNPDGANNNGPDSDDNYWYRLFEYVEVPSRIHRQLANPLENFRVPGKINLNTIRHPSILAALIDDMGGTGNVLNLSIYNDDVTNGRDLYRLRNQDPSDTTRDWWLQFILSRDATDPVANLELPGTPGSRPFRSFDFFGSRNVPSTGVRDLRENTIFRSLPSDIAAGFPNDPRLLFEIANRTEHENGASDFHTRNRILSKIMGNTTTRSNTFIVFMSVAYFEASGPGLTTFDDYVQIGDRAHGKTVHEADYRGFFVIDRTRIEEAFEPTTQKFDNWKRLIRHRHLIQSIQED